jgi:hypothetical protein
MYKLGTIMFGQTKPASVIRTIDGACIPFDTQNTDYANFTKDLANGAELQDAEGNVIDGLAYLATLESQGNE